LVRVWLMDGAGSACVLVMVLGAGGGPGWMGRGMGKGAPLVGCCAEERVKRDPEAGWRGGKCGERGASGGSDAAVMRGCSTHN
jgi:hypothetical protein